MFSRKTLFRITLNTLLGLGLVYVWSRFVNLEEIIQTLSRVNPVYILIAFCFYFSSTILRGLRLTLLLSSFNFPLKDSTLLTALSQFLSFLIPIRAGEVSKAVYISTQFNQPLGKSVIWVFLDRFLDFWAVFFLIGLGLILIPTSLPSTVIKMAVGLFLISTVGGLILLRNKQNVLKIINFLSNFLIVKSIKRVFVSVTTTILDGADIIKLQPLFLIKIALLSLLAFILDGMFWWMMFLGVKFDIGLIKAVLGNALMALTFLLPAAPGFVGSTEASGLLVYSGALGVETGIASAATVLFHLSVVLFMLILGLGSLYLLKFDLNLVWKQLRRK